MKDRDISILDFFNALQREYISLEIRSKIYVSRKTKEYFYKLMAKKKDAIVSLARRNNLPSIIEDEGKYFDLWKDMVPKFGFPKLVYNVGGLSKEQLTFPYKDTAVQVGERYGLAYRVNFDENTVDVILYGDEKPTTFNRSDVQRLAHRETDEYFYYYPKNQFNTAFGVGMLTAYNMKTKVANIFLDDQGSLVCHANDIARIL